jgi:hypothetical protein
MLLGPQPILPRVPVQLVVPSSAAAVVAAAAAADTETRHRHQAHRTAHRIAPHRGEPHTPLQEDLDCTGRTATAVVEPDTAAA